MPATKTIKKVEKLEIKPFKRNINFFSKLYKLNLMLLTIALLIWIFVGSYLSLNVLDSVKAAAKQKAMSTLDNQTYTPPTTAQVPGLGEANVECLQKSVDTATIQKVFSDNGTQNISAADKAKLEACVTAESATPSASPAN